jgi:acyl carrier protein
VTKDEIRAAVLAILAGIAPEADLTRLKPDEPLRDQLDIDSIDFMNFLIAVDEQLRVDIPETDYARVATLDRCVEHLATLLPPGPGGRPAAPERP